ncbi:MAG: polysaccharide biosynthesis protein [Oscillospiraceae bacterium]|nr:polysaccharide biosynthesis protein [Oscillospiraceae bacterium]
MSIDTKSVRYGAFILTFANILSQLLGFVYRMFLSRLVGPEGMGLFQLIFPFYSLSLALASSGICVAVSKLSAEYLALGNYKSLRLLIRRAVFVFLALFSLISLVAFLFTDTIAVSFLGDERTRLAIFALVPCVLLTGIENIHKNYFYGTKNVNPPALSDLAEQLIRMSAVLLLLKLLLPQPDDRMLAIIVIGMCICEVFSSVFLRLVYQRHRKKLPKTGHSDPEMVKKITKIALPVSVTNLMNNLLSSLIVIVIPRRLVLSGLTQSGALSEFGTLFGMTMPLLTLPSALIVGLSLVMVPKLSENMALGNYRDLRNKVSRAIMVTSFLVLPVLSVMIPLGPKLGLYLFGHEINGQYIFPLAVGTILAIYMMVFGSILNGLGKQTASAVNFLIGNAAELILTFLLTSIPTVRMYGYITGFIVSTVITASLNFYRVVKVTKVKVEWLRWFVNPALASLLCALVARLIFVRCGDMFSDGLLLLLSLTGAAVVYLLAAAYQGISLEGVLSGRKRRKQ